MCQTLNLFLTGLLQKTAWTMEPPKPYSLFHLSFSFIGLFLAVRLSVYLARRLAVKQLNRLLWVCGFLLAVAEVYKQLFLYYVVYLGDYNWWYFPFQLCSMPMYLCLLLPLLGRYPRAHQTVCTFLQDFCLLGGIMSLAEPSGLLHPYWTLTLHGLWWHVMLVFIGLLICFSGLSGQTRSDYLRTLPLLACFCAAATCINVATHGEADMFYISPYYPVSQAVFHQISLVLGTAAGILVYLLSLCAGGFLCHLLANAIARRFPPSAVS